MEFKAFVSSTFKDLVEHRKFVINAISKAGIAVDPMENWTAESNEPKLFSQDRLEGCDLCILLVALRRGHTPEKEKHSITQLEYYSAIEKDIDVLVFMLEENAPWLRNFDELDKDPELVKWRRNLMGNHGVGFFTTSPDSIEIEAAITRWITKRKASDRIVHNAISAGKKAPGLLRIVNVRAKLSKYSKEHTEYKAIIDFWVSNDGGSQILITNIEFLVIDTARAELIKGPLKSSETYNLDITDLREPGDTASCETSQIVAPGESDRFSVEMVAKLGLGVFGVWKLQPILKTNYGGIKYECIEVWLPFKESDFTFEEVKDVQRIERKHGVKR